MPRTYAVAADDTGFMRSVMIPGNDATGRPGCCSILLSVLWGGAFFFIGAALRELPPLTVVLVRVAGWALVCCLPFIEMLGGALPKRLAGWKPFFVMGMLNNVIPFSLSGRRADLYLERACLGAQRDDATVHRAGDGGASATSN